MKKLISYPFPTFACIHSVLSSLELAWWLSCLFQAVPVVCDSEGCREQGRAQDLAQASIAVW